MRLHQILKKILLARSQKLVFSEDSDFYPFNIPEHSSGHLRNIHLARSQVNPLITGVSLSVVPLKDLSLKGF
jgi:hypothetical protein